MDMNNFRPELHIAQQSRRDKLRVQQDPSPPHQHLGVYNANNLDQIYESSGLRNCRTGSICYDSSEFNSEMINPTSFNASSTVTTDPQYYTTWDANQGSIFVGEGSLKIVNSDPISSSDAKSYMGYHQDMHSSSGYVDVNSNSSLYHNALMQQLVTSSNARSFGLEFASLREKGSGEGGCGSWVGGGNELVLLPTYADQWGGGQTEPCFAVAKDGDRDVRVVRNDHSSTQALSLSLSCKAQENQIGEKDFQTVGVNCGKRNMSSGSRVLRQQSLTHRNPGPLGPFTGYATILRSSKFLRPAQMLLEELCCIAQPKDVEKSDVPDNIFEEFRVSRDVVGSNTGPAMKGVAGNSGGLSFLIDGSSNKGRDSPSLSSHQPENLEKKAKLLYMQDEVCKKYKQYHQQMQMVVSSFESVAGLTAATPFVSLALKMISKHFRSLKNAITDQLKGLKYALGEESSPVSSKGDATTNVSMLKLFDQNYDHKDKGSSILESQHIWRPQRGLPERAVSILRAWLFDHFLHPYPTDTDKHMLATQTGLTRNQVSNWFINARVRVWKPMVEEIHMLETKGVQTDAASDANVGNNILSDKPVGCSRGESMEEGRENTGAWSQEKRSRNEYHMPDGAFLGGIGSVSLTLGLRQGAENGARPVMQQERLLRPYGGQVIRDFVG